VTDNETLFTAEEAAAQVGVDKATIYTWTARGYLAPVPGRKRGRANLFKLEDVFTCEKTRKRKHRRRQ
jgi:excisionase family DNA binding protein